MEPMENIRLVLSKNIKDIRKRRGMNQNDLAELSNLSVGMIKLLETNKRWPSPATIEAVAKGLGVTIGELFDGAAKGEQMVILNIRQMTAQLLAIPDEVYAMAQNFGPEHPVWTGVKIVLRDRLAKEQETSGGAVKSQKASGK